MMKRPWRAATGSPAVSGSPSRSSLVRSKTGPESIRGRISGPIPIPNPMEDSFIVPASTTNTPTNRAIAVTDGLEANGSTPEPPHGEQTGPPAMAISSPREALLRSPEPDQILSSSLPSSTLRQVTSPPPKANQPTTVRYSVASVSAGTDRSRNSKEPQRKKSTLRGALGRLFGRKKHSDSPEPSGASSRKTTPRVSNQQVIEQDLREPNDQNKRSFSLPVSQYDRALRSHSVGPDDVLAIESARNSVSVDFGGFNRRSRGLGNFHMHARRATDTDWTGLSPRPLSSHARGIGIGIVNNVSDPDNIGRAITCDSTNKRRRSRSMSGLPDLEEDHGDLRRRSDEIRYWRESYDPNLGRPISSMAPEGENVEIETLPVEAANSVAEQPQTPPQPFSFGNITELAGMKITQAASMDTRIGSLESRMRRLEKVVTQVCNAVPNFQPQSETERAPAPSHKGRAHLSVFATSSLDAKGSSRPSTQHSQASKTSFGDAPTFVGSIPASNAHLAPAGSQRPLSTATIRAAASLPTLSKETNGSYTVDHLTALTALLETERAARQALEAQVKSLGHQIAIMANTSQRGIPEYDLSPTDRSFGQRSAFDQDDDYEDDEGEIPRNRGPRADQLPQEDSGIGTGDADEDDYSETFITPHEDARKHGPFDQNLDDEDASLRKTTRTMSLSQMTLKKSSPAPMPEAHPQMI